MSKTKKTLDLYRRILGSQLEIKDESLDRNQELLMEFALDKRLGVISAVNCKSGLDRTGFIHALFLSAMDLSDDELLEIAYSWKVLSLELNTIYRNNNYNPEYVMVQIESRQNDFERKNLRAFFEMQQNVLQHLIKVSLPITGISTGIIGLKYSKGLSENLLPLYCIPPIVKMESGKVIQILTYNKKGKPEGLTEDGHRLITQLSQSRGS